MGHKNPRIGQHRLLLDHRSGDICEVVVGAPAERAGWFNYFRLDGHAGAASVGQLYPNSPEALEFLQASFRLETLECEAQVAAQAAGSAVRAAHAVEIEALRYRLEVLREVGKLPE